MNATSKAPFIFDEPGYGRLPCLCVNQTGHSFAVWITCTHRGESVRMSTRPPFGEWTTPRRILPFRPFVTGLAVAPWRDRTLLAWIDGGYDGSGLKLTEIADGEVGEIRSVAPSATAPAHPALAADHRGVAVVWTQKEHATRRTMCLVGDTATSTEAPFALSSPAETAFNPAVCRIDGHTAVVWQSHRRSITRVVLCRLDPARTLTAPTAIAEEQAGTVANPAICPSVEGGYWLAWQSDVDPALGGTLVRGLEVVHVARDGTLGRPTAPPPPVEKQGKAEDQGFESPALATLEDGRLLVIGRGSQSVRRQVLGAAGWSDRLQIDAGGWSCRGRRFAVATAPDGVVIVGRRRDGVTAEVHSTDVFPDNGPPPLSPMEPPPEFTVPASLPPRERLIQGYRAMFGDIHQHTIASDGTGTAEETFLRARNRYHDDIVAVSDHESFLGKRTPEGEWRELCRATDEFYEPGSFVTLHAVEWTGAMHPGPGHKVVYLPSGAYPLLSRDDDRTRTSKGLMHTCRELGALVVPHHVGWTGADMEHHSPDVQPCWEIVSCHGAYERQGVGPIGTRGDDKPGQFIGDALDRNLRFGFVGGSDGHGLSWHHGVSRKQDSHRTGLTAFLARECTRPSVWKALQKRRCYATSGVKIGLWFEVDGRPMGEEIVAGTTVPFRVLVSATAPIESLTLVSNGGLELVLDAHGTTADVRGSLPPPPDDMFSYYYIRVIQNDKEMAWSSPIWLDPPEPA